MFGQTIDGTTGKKWQDDKKGLRVRVTVDLDAGLTDTELHLLAASRGFMIQEKKVPAGPQMRAIRVVNGRVVHEFGKQELKTAYQLYLKPDSMGGKKAYITTYYDKDELAQVLAT